MSISSGVLSGASVYGHGSATLKGTMVTVSPSNVILVDLSRAAARPTIARRGGRWASPPRGSTPPTELSYSNDDIHVRDIRICVVLEFKCVRGGDRRR